MTQYDYLMRRKREELAAEDWGNEVEIEGQLHFIMDEKAIIAIE